MARKKGALNKNKKTKAQIMKHRKNMAVGFDKELSIAEHDKLFGIDADMRKALNDPKGWKSGSVGGMSVKSKNDEALVKGKAMSKKKAQTVLKRVKTEDGKHSTISDELKENEL